MDWWLAQDRPSELLYRSPKGIIRDQRRYYNFNNFRSLSFSFFNTSCRSFLLPGPFLNSAICCRFFLINWSIIFQHFKWSETAIGTSFTETMCSLIDFKIWFQEHICFRFPILKQSVCFVIDLVDSVRVSWRFEKVMKIYEWSEHSWSMQQGYKHSYFLFIYLVMPKSIRSGILRRSNGQ